MSYAVKLVTADPDHNTSMKRDDNVWDGEGWSSEFSEEFTLRSDSPDEKCMHRFSAKSNTGYSWYDSSINPDKIARSRSTACCRKAANVPLTSSDYGRD